MGMYAEDSTVISFSSVIGW